MRAYKVPASTYASAEDYYPFSMRKSIRNWEMKREITWRKKVVELKRFGIAKVSFVTPEGLGADEIIAHAHKTPDSLVAMCTHAARPLAAGSWEASQKPCATPAILCWLCAPAESALEQCRYIKNSCSAGRLQTRRADSSVRAPDSGSVRGYRGTAASDFSQPCELIPVRSRDLRKFLLPAAYAYAELSDLSVACELRCIHVGTVTVH